MLSRCFSVLLVAGLLPGCGDGGEGAPSDTPSNDGGAPEGATGPFSFTSPAFEGGGVIPSVHRCAEGSSPPLEWSSAPSGTESFAIVMKDLDFMNGFLHWIVYDIPVTEVGLPEGVPLGYAPAMPAGAKQASVLQAGYFGPCSPISTNTYQFTLYALDVPALPGLTETSPGADVVAQIEDHAIENVSIEGESGPN